MTDAKDTKTPLINRSVESPQVRSAKRTRLPITRVFSAALTIILGLFIAIVLLTYVRLQDFRLALTDIVEKSVPSVAFSNQIYSQVNSLTYMAERLGHASTDATRRVAMSQITAQLLQLKALAQSQESDRHLQVQLNALNLEFRELNNMIVLRLNSEKELATKQQTLYELYNEATELSENKSQRTTDGQQYDWTLTVSSLVASAGSTFNMNRLHLLRQTGEQIRQQLALLDQQVLRIKDSDQEEARVLSQKLRQTLIGDSGLIDLQVKRLQIAGRAIGRGNFVRNLLIDYSGLTEFEAAKVNETVIAESTKTQESVLEQIRLIGLFSSIAIGVILAATVFLQRRVVNRLNKLNQRVGDRLQGNSSNIYIGGNDEISDIGQTFDLFAETVEEQNKKLHDLSLLDSLTGISNRRALDERLLDEVKEAHRHKWSLSVMIIDVDYFKLYNDHYGHDKGDECLRALAKLLDEQMQRNGDFVGRYGGEEFVCLLPDTDGIGAEHVAQILLESVVEQQIPHQFSKVAPFVTISLGIATLNQNNIGEVGPLVLLKQADQALYRAKDQGRNRFINFASISKDSKESKN